VTHETAIILWKKFAINVVFNINVVPAINAIPAINPFFLVCLGIFLHAVCPSHAIFISQIKRCLCNACNVLFSLKSHHSHSHKPYTAQPDVESQSNIIKLPSISLLKNYEVNANSSIVFQTSSIPCHPHALHNFQFRFLLLAMNFFYT
jgi:hypothetical protein